jgi:hypothetical protein
MFRGTVYHIFEYSIVSIAIHKEPIGSADDLKRSFLGYGGPCYNHLRPSGQCVVATFDIVAKLVSLGRG